MPEIESTGQKLTNEQREEVGRETCVNMLRTIERKLTILGFLKSAEYCGKAVEAATK